MLLIKELLSKISSYNLFNYLFPGVIFVVAAKETTNYNFVQDDIVLGAFLYYLIGMIVSRVGSLIVEPLLKKFKVVNFADYQDFVEASKKDAKIELLSEVNNTYRTLASLFFLLLSLKLYAAIETKFPILENLNEVSIISLLLIMFLFSYRKQTNYITKRVKNERRTK